MYVQISASVGANGQNSADDVMKIKQAFNDIPEKWGAPKDQLVVDGSVSQSFIDVITFFQQFHRLGIDGLIDPDMATINKMNSIFEGLELWASRPGGASGTGSTLKTWLNAFIPGEIPGLTQVLTAGPFAGQTVINGPSTWFNDCFRTDQRSFDSEIHASSRMHSEVEIDLDMPGINLQWHNCDKTHEIDCEDGDPECEDSGNTSRMYFYDLQVLTDTTLSIKLRGETNNPCFSGSPDIDYEGEIKFDVVNKEFSFDGYVDAFPAFEMYVTLNNGAPISVFQLDPPTGGSPSNLFGGPNRAIAVAPILA